MNMVSKWGNITSSRSTLAASVLGENQHFEKKFPVTDGEVIVSLKKNLNGFVLTVTSGSTLERITSYLESFDEEFAQALFEYLEAGAAYITPAGEHSLFTIHNLLFGHDRSYRHASAGLSNYLKSSATPREKAIAFLGFQRLDFSEKQIHEMVQKHGKLFPEGPQDDNFVQYFLPQYSFLQAEEAVTLSKVVKSVRDYQIFTSPEGLLLARAGITIENDEKLRKEGESLPLTDWDTFMPVHGKYYSIRFAKLPLHTKKFREYVLSLTGGQFSKLIGQVPGASSADAAIEFSEKLLVGEKQNKEAVLLAVTQDFASITPVLARYEDPYLFTNVFTLFMSVYQTPSRSALMASYIKTVDRTHLMESHRLLAVLNGLIGSKWVKPTHMADLVIEKLLTVGTHEEVAKVLVDTSLDGQSLTVKQWEVFLENFDTYKDLTVGWWLPLVKRVSGD